MRIMIISSNLSFCFLLFCARRLSFSFRPWDFAARPTKLLNCRAYPQPDILPFISHLLSVRLDWLVPCYIYPIDGNVSRNQ
jgi:hypothetical protein